MSTDELFLLQVAQRVFNGEVLYRDVFFGATPLAVYISLLAALLKGELLVIRALNSLIFAGMGLLSVLLAQQVGLGWRSKVLIVFGLAAYSSPLVMGTGSMYTPLSHLFLLACYPWAYYLLSRRDGRVTSAWYSVLGGVLAGLSFSTKQNTGMYAFSFILGILIWQAWRSREGWKHWVKHLLVAAGGFAACAAVLVLLPVGLSGGLEKFLDYGFLNKGTYVKYASLTYWGHVQGWVNRAAASSASWVGINSVFFEVPSLFPFVNLGGLAWVWLRSPGRERDTATLLIAATVTSMLEVFPRVERGHISCTMPVILTGIAYIVSRCVSKAQWKNLLAILGGLWLVANLACMYKPQVEGFVRGEFQLSRVTHFRLLLLPASTIDYYYGIESALAPLKGDSIFILHPSAALYYLLGGIHNPTPYDYPLVTAFGVDGERRTIEALEDGTLSQICIMPISHILAPVLLQEYVLNSMQEVHDYGVCRLYRTARNPAP